MTQHGKTLLTPRDEPIQSPNWTARKGARKGHPTEGNEASYDDQAVTNH